MKKEEHEQIKRCVHDKYEKMFKYVNSLGLKRKRAIFQRLRQYAPVEANDFMPDMGLTAGQFAVFQKENCVASKVKKTV